MNHVDTDIGWAPDPDVTAFWLLATVTPSPCTFALQKALGLTYWAYDPEDEEFAWLERKPNVTPGFVERRADIKAILAKYDQKDSSKLLAAIQEAVCNGISGTYRITMQVDTPHPTVFSIACVRSAVAGRAMVLGLMRNCEKDMRNEMYLLGVRDLLSDFCASSPSGVLLVDNDGTIREMNDRFAALFGVEGDRTLGGADIRFLENTLGKTLVAKLSDALRTRKQFQGRTRFLLKGGPGIELNFRIFNFQFRDDYGGIAFAADEVQDTAKVPAGAMLESILSPVIVFDRRTGLISFANEAARTAFGVETRHYDTEKVTDLLLSAGDMVALDKAVSRKGRHAGRIATVTRYSKGTDKFLILVARDSDRPDTHAVLEFLPVGRMQAFFTTVGAQLGLT